MELDSLEKYDPPEMRALLEAAGHDPALAGFVYPEDTARVRLPLFAEKRLVGFASPRQDKDGVWRMGAIYILPEFRNRGLASAAIAQFMKGKRGRAFIEDQNQGSQRAYEKAGFRPKRRSQEDGGSWWENF